MRHVRPVRLVLTASLTAVAVAIALHPQQAPEAAPTTSTPAPIDTLVATADPSMTVPTTPDARAAVARLVRPVPDIDPDQIPVAALAAYQRAAAVAAKVDKDCGITWTMLAAIGGIESDHGRHGGATLGTDGVSSPPIRGVALDGKGPVARVADTDAGQVDGDRRWDRAVGPMQFLPATWATVGVDADGDGERSADDIDDAALGAAVFLCAVPGDLTDRAGVRAALLRYNPSEAYVAEVIALEQEYRTGDYAEPDVTGVSAVVVQAARQPHTAQSDPPADQGGRDPQAESPDDDGKDPGKDPGQGDGQQHWPDHEPDPSTEPEPEPEPEPDPDPLVEELTGVLTACGTEEAPAWCVEDAVLDLGDEEYLAAPALGDFDGDTVVETNAEELAGLADTEITLVVQRRDDAAALVLAIGDLDYVADSNTGATD